MNSVAKPLSVKRLAQGKLRLCVLALDVRHHPGTCLRVHNISHLEPWHPFRDVVYSLHWNILEIDLSANFGIVDLFAGPGGLGEGFASLRDSENNPFSIEISVEKEWSAHRTLTLRAFLREYRRKMGRLPEEFLAFHAGRIPEPSWSDIDANAWSHAVREARRLELGTSEAVATVDGVIDAMKGKFDENVLIGGPPCQAYSLVGRARSRGKADYVPEEDARHFLFREYIRVLDRLRPAVFVMENVKGMLSSMVSSRKVFEMLMDDLQSLGHSDRHLYELKAIKINDGHAKLVAPGKPQDFVVRAEEFGIPQRRHRVIIVGVRADIASRSDRARAIVSTVKRSVSDTISNLPALQSGLSKRKGKSSDWRLTVAEAAIVLADLFRHDQDSILREGFCEFAERFPLEAHRPRSSVELPHRYGQSNDELLKWIENPELLAIAQHETRGHMTSDLSRYLFASIFAGCRKFSPKASDFPVSLSPNHRNWDTGVFNDRFRVQLAHEPSTTVTSHISKDGHYFIHPDPYQCRSLTVREAARLQTFPDDYLFLGNRTEQYVQVGNAVPPLLARQIASLILNLLRS